MIPAILTGLAALAVGGGFAWWSWRDRLGGGIERTAAAARALGIAAVVLLATNPALGSRVFGGRPLVLLDNSVSMHAAGGRASDAAVLAASLGDTVSFGELAPGEPGAQPALADALRGTVVAGRPVILVTDGEIAEAGDLPTALRAAISVRVVARTRGPDLALVEVRAPARLSAGDTLWVEVDATRTSDAPDTARIEVRSGVRPLLQGTVHFGGAGRASIRLSGVLPMAMIGEQWLSIVRIGDADSEPGDDVRWWRLHVTPTPGVVVLAATPDWDARFLYRTLREVVESPVRGYVQLQPGSWRRMDDLRRVSLREVNAAARGADLLAVRGGTAGWQAIGRARLLWAPSAMSGDWYVGAGHASPVAGAFVGAQFDSLAPASGATPLAAPAEGGWVGLTARLARRGAEVPVVIGRVDAGGRTVVVGADGLYRWGFRGGVSEQLWRGLIASSAAWLLASPETEGARAVPVSPVTQRGRPVRFRWVAASAATPVPIRFDVDGRVRADTLRFDGSGEAAVALPTGRYRYVLEGGGGGSLAVEPFSNELLPAPVTLAAQTATVTAAPLQRSLREVWWLWVVAVISVVVEWSLRRRLGLR